MKYNYKPKDKEKDSRKLQHERRVTYDYNGTAIIRLQERRDVFKEENDDKGKSTPLENYYKKKCDNAEIYEQIEMASTLKDKLSLSHGKM